MFFLATSYDSFKIQVLVCMSVSNMHVNENTVDWPFLSYKGDVELVSLELFAWVGHYLIKGAFQ